MITLESNDHIPQNHVNWFVNVILFEWKSHLFEHGRMMDVIAIGFQVGLTLECGKIIMGFKMVCCNASYNSWFK